MDPNDPNPTESGPGDTPEADPTTGSQPPTAGDPAVAGSTVEAAQAGAANPSIEEQLEATRAERDEAKNKVLRTYAELDNYRRRANDERDKARKYQSLALARDLLPHVDNLRRAIQVAEDESNADGTDSVTQGVRLVLQGMQDTFKQHGVTEIDASVGTAFDPNVHEALSQVPREQMPDAAPMSIVQEIERGYMLHDQLVRPSKVIVVAA